MSIETYMMSLKPMVLETSEFQHQQKSKDYTPHGFPSMWGSQNHISRRVFFGFWKQLCFFKLPRNKYNSEKRIPEVRRKTLLFTLVVFEKKWLKH